MLALHLSHVESGLHIEECLYPGHVYLSREGVAARFLPGEGFVALSWYELRAESVELQFLEKPPTRQKRRVPVQWQIDGVMQRADVLKLGQRLEWNGWIVDVREVPLPGPKVREMSDRARGDDDALRVFCDWLEANGAVDAALFGRAMIETIPRDRLEVIARRVPTSVRALVARGPVERCERRCSQTWQSLAFDSSEPWKKSCATCSARVSFCDEPRSVPREGPVVISAQAQRSWGDLLGMPIVG